MILQKMFHGILILMWDYKEANMLIGETTEIIRSISSDYN